MAITKEYLQSEVENLRKQHTHALSVAQQAVGAIGVLESLIQKLDSDNAVQDGIPIKEFAEALGGVSAEVVSNE